MPGDYTGRKRRSSRTVLAGLGVFVVMFLTGIAANANPPAELDRAIADGRLERARVQLIAGRVVPGSRQFTNRLIALNRQLSRILQSRSTPKIRRALDRWVYGSEALFVVHGERFVPSPRLLRIASWASLEAGDADAAAVWLCELADVTPLTAEDQRRARRIFQRSRRTFCAGLTP